MELSDASAYVAAAASGSVTTGFIAKVLIQNWIKRKDDEGSEVAKTLTTIAVELGKIGVQMVGLQRSAETSLKFGEAIAVMQTRISDITENVNYIFDRLKDMRQ